MTPAEPSHPTPAGTEAAGPPSSGRQRPWVPIRSLSAAHRARILEHLCTLSERDRYLRFGYPATDEQIGRYTDSLDFEHDEVFGIFNRHLALIAVAHLAYPSLTSNMLGVPPTAAEFGGSVAERARGRGYGARLFEHAMLHARNRGFDTLFIHALSENTAMLRIARRAGGVVHRVGSETDAYVRLPPDTLASRMEQWVGEGAATIDYRLKHQARLLDAVIDAIGDVKSSMAERGGHAGTD